MKFKSNKQITKELIQNEGEKISRFLNIVGNYSPSVFDEEWEVVEIVSGVKQINEELKEEIKDDNSKNNSSISESQSN
tara:strand:- start:4036 stop:4269 length:234 start_codon:yes stop_codon:yes gene_type:complete